MKLRTYIFQYKARQNLAGDKFLKYRTSNYVKLTC